MPPNDRDIALESFSSREWRSAADALFQASGAAVNVMDFNSGDLLVGGSPCPHCQYAAEMTSPGPRTCFDVPPEVDSGPSRVLCRSGMPTLSSPVLHAGRPIAHVVLGGFVTSTRDRRRLWEILAARGVHDEAVRLAVKSVTVVSRRAADAYLEIALACARTVVDATAERLSSAERVEELRLFVSAGQQAVTSDQLDPAALGGMVEEAVALIGGDAGAVLRPIGAFFEVVARSEGWRGIVGGLLPRAETAPGRALETRRTVVSRAGRKAATLAMPLVIGGRVLGVLEVRLPADALPVEPGRVARLDRFGRFISIALERDDERSQVERAMSGYAQLNELSAALGGVSDVDSVIRIASDVIDRAFSFEVCGLVLSSWASDRADVMLRGEVTTGELSSLLGEVAGRDISKQPFEAVNTRVLSGGALEGEVRDADWASVVAELEHGDLVVGYVFLASRDGTRYNAQDHALLAGIAAHAGSALGRVALFTRIRDDYAKTIAALSATLDAGEHMPSGHSSRVMEYSMMIGEELGLPFEDVEQLRFAGLLHDIGKTGLPSELLLKPSKLSSEELEKVRAHAQLGASIVDQIEFLKALTPIILHHHERYDGSGYPSGLAGDEIPLLARILAVADSFDAMCSTRAHHKQLTRKQACSELDAQAGTQFEPRVVQALLKALEKQSVVGSTGLLAPREALGSPRLPA